jgi:hypothetical protein
VPNNPVKASGDLKNEQQPNSLSPLKGPKLEIFGFRVFSQIRPVWVGDLVTRQNNSKF